MFKILKNVAVASWAICGLLLIGMILSPRLRSAVYDDNQATGYTNIRTGNIKLTGSGVYDSNGVLRYTPGSTNAIIGGLTTTGTLGLLTDAAPRTNITPVAIGALVYNSTYNEVCMSTGTTKYTWALLSSSTTVCHN